MTPKQYCQEKAAKSGSSFYYSFMFLPKQKREAITALYAFCREVDDVVDECTELKVAQVKLAWWKDEVRNLYLKKPIHPVTKALEPVIQQFQLDEEHFHEIIDGMEMDLNFNRYEDYKQLQLYCYRVASVVGILSAQIFGFENRKTLKFAHDLGMAFQLTNIIRDVGEDARRNRIYLPLDELAKFNVTEDDILKSRESDAVKRLLDAQIERAEMYYDKALNELPAEDKKSQRVGLIMTAIYRTLLREIKADGAEKVLNARISLGTLRKLWIAFSTWFKYL
ncbi:MAG: squalene synthase HpnD [Methylotenera sp.]|uniref:presqualene diphosphate synthase HpnD n=1 Tax=Methylotenera sp. TaxID=2051956 RepID=UPI000D479388|nr:presqualene diphosphate synthase HpnD [Methylotenera sp.]MDP3211661.1 presqualene diphosphate synthase HpnD [Methylotenera sp.]MDP3776230.1 presqualene diphosphate synthase HpnD [Methylotenera sp.]PPC96110.1 MAG: squalene synthase HpnD [Methylotenera sp.]